MEKRVLKKELIFVGLIGFTLVGCSDVTRVSYSVPPELMQVRMEAASLLEEANSIEETGATIGRGLISELETAAPQISSDSADIEKFKSYLSELEGLKSNDVEGIKALTGKMVACIEIPEGISDSLCSGKQEKQLEYFSPFSYAVFKRLLEQFSSSRFCLDERCFPESSDAVV